MRSLTGGHVKAGLDSLRNTKLRNFWTMLGVIIGVASVISIVAIGEGVKQQVSGQIHQYGKNLITIRPAQLHLGSGIGNDGANLLSGISVGGSLSAKDISTVSNTPGVGAASPLTIVTGEVKGEAGSYKNGFVVGTSPDLPSLLNQSVAYGAFITDNDAGNAAVLGPKAAKVLFDDDVPLGHSFTLRGQQFIVHGVFNDFTNASLGEEADFNNAIFISYDSAQDLTNKSAPTYQILAKPNDTDQTGAVASAIKSNLDKNHGGRSDVDVLQGQQNIAASDEIITLLTSLIAGVAAISLLVGGIGIMNVMLVSVAERIHEIGIRKAVGATNRQILSQFMIESTTLSFFGGLIGVGVAYLINLSLRVTTDLQPVITWQIVALATGVSLLVGIVFGCVPALQAARKDPIDALRSE
jgi:ABC-type antimicrobial peptide transport system permease subunit